MARTKIGVSVQIEVYRKYKTKIFQTNGKAKPYSDKIYKTLVGELNGMSEKSIQMSINRHVKDILTNEQVNACEFGNVNTQNCTPQFVDETMIMQEVESNAEVVDSGGGESNAQCLPSEFVEVSMHFTDNDEIASRCSSPLSNSYNLQGDHIEEVAETNRRNDPLFALYHKNPLQEVDEANRDSLRELYHKETVQGETEEIYQAHESIDKLVSSYRNKIAKINESHGNISLSFQNNVKIAEEEISRLNQKDSQSAKVIDMANTKISELEIRLSDQRKAFDEEISRLYQKDTQSAKPIDMANTKISELEIRLSDQRKAFDEEISRLYQKDTQSAKLIDMANTKISELEIRLSDQRKAFDEEISRLYQKDTQSAKLIDIANTKISELEIRLSDQRKAFDEEISRLYQKDTQSAKLIDMANTNLDAVTNSVKRRKHSRRIDITPREKRIRKCNAKN